MLMPRLWLPGVLVALLLIAAFTRVDVSAACPANGPVTSDLHAVGCSDLQLSVEADNVTLLIEAAIGKFIVSSGRNGTVLRLLDSTVNAGSVALRGSHTIAEAHRSWVTWDRRFHPQRYVQRHNWCR